MVRTENHQNQTICEYLINFKSKISISNHHQRLATMARSHFMWSQTKWPYEITTAPSVSSFKRKLDKLVFNHQPPSTVQTSWTWSVSCNLSTIIINICDYLIPISFIFIIILAFLLGVQFSPNASFIELSTPIFTQLVLETIVFPLHSNYHSIKLHITLTRITRYTNRQKTSIFTRTSAVKWLGYHPFDITKSLQRY